MKLLAIETATEACSAALWLDGQTFERFELAPRRHTELILPMVNELLAGAGLQLTDLDGLAFGRGPGSFTGLRIAAGVIQGLALAANLPVVAVSTLASLAQTLADQHTHVLAALDARMHEVYCGYYVRDGECCMRLQDRELVCPPDQVPLPVSGRWTGAGSGWNSYAETLTIRFADIIEKTVSDVWPRAAATARLAVTELAAGHTLTAAEARPVYLRDQVIQVRHKNNN